MENKTLSQGWRHVLWLVLLVAASVAFSLGFACAVPFAAFGAVAALTLTRWAALILIVAVWLANQITGFGFLGYPWTADTFMWGCILGAIALLSTGVSQFLAGRLKGRNVIVGALVTFAGAFVMYEGGLFLVSTVLGGIEDYVPSIMARILEINAAAFAGLLVLDRLAIASGLVTTPAIRFAAAARLS